MKRKIKKLFKTHSPYLIFLTAFEIVFTVIAILGFVYNDTIDIDMLQDVELLIDNLYSQTWWGFVLLSLGFISIFALTSIVYKKLEYMFMSICTWTLLFVVAININNSLTDFISICLLYIPVILINIIAYRTEKRKLMSKPEKIVKDVKDEVKKEVKKVTKNNKNKKSTK